MTTNQSIMEESSIVTIFQNDVIKITCRENLVNDSKSVIVHVNAINPIDGKLYEKNAGWLSRTLALHGTANTREYAYVEGLKQIAINKEEIRCSLVKFGRTMEDCDKSGLGVIDKISHPFGEGQRQKVRKIMQKNAPIGTNHL